MSDSKSVPDSVSVVPVTTDDLGKVAEFLHQNLNKRNSVEDWLRGIAPPWSTGGPNHGVMLCDGERIVGAFPAIYYRREIAGNNVVICNPHSWFVLESHRAQSMALVLSLVKQPGFEFVMLSPNPSVAEIFKFLKFKAVDPGLVLMPCIPSPLTVFSRVKTASRVTELEQLLNPRSLEVFRDHQQLPWLLHLAVADAEHECYIVFKRHRVKGIPVARVLHVSDPHAFARLWRNIANALLMRFGLFGVMSEERWFVDLPQPVIRRVNGQPKLLFGKLIDERSIDDLYTELVALDI